MALAKPTTKINRASAPVSGAPIVFDSPIVFTNQADAAQPTAGDGNYYFGPNVRLVPLTTPNGFKFQIKNGSGAWVDQETKTQP